MNRRAPIGDEGGFSVVEVLVASIILVIGALAVFQTFSAAVHNVQRGRESQAGITVAQREMEKIRGLSYQAIALKTPPGTSTNTAEPNYRVSGGSYNVNRTGTASYATLVVSGAAGAVEPSSSAFSVGGAKVTVYRYVVWRKDVAYCATGTNSEKESCKTGQNFKRVIIAVVPQQSGNTPSVRPYYELQSDFVNPVP